ncbi:PREDICTED: uncharacterized protein PB18E9.04c-like [Cyprinodon variegatus]|uniref:uncharacterized protein PB18E9.04c-like n=1 Tax=Cyprinodon variegatus TaxID=28743 RepID=UPI000742C553|nr:PREDICTED: uncharacterized protein PB18E9.04c-like [Cyprinodon variegatus]
MSTKQTPQTTRSLTIVQTDAKTEFSPSTSTSTSVSHTATTSISMQQEKSTQITSLTTKSGNPVQTSSFAVKNTGTFASKQPTTINPSGGPTTTQVNTISRSASLTTSQTMIITKTSERDKTANHSQSSTATKTPYKTLTSITDHTTIPMGNSETAINPAMPSSSMTLTKTTIKATSLTPSEMTGLKTELTERFTNTKSFNATDQTARPDVALTQTITSVAIQQEKLTKITSSTIQSTEPLENSSSVRTSSERKISAPAAAQEPTAKQIVGLTTSQVINSGQVSLSKASTTQTAWYGASMQNSTTLQVGQTTVKGLIATTHHTSTNMVESFATTSTMRPPSSVISATEQTSISSIGISPYVKPTTIDTVVTQLHNTLNVSQETQTVAAETTEALVPVKSFTADKESIGSTAVDKKIDSADTTMSMVTSPQETTPRTAYTMALGEEPKAITGKEDQNVTSLQSLQSSNTSSQPSLRASLDPVGTTRTTFFSIKIEENHSKSTSPWASETTEMDKVTTKSTDVEHESTETTNSSLHASSANQLQSTQVKYNATTLPVSQNRTVFFKYSQRVVVPRRLIFDYPVVERATFFTNNTENDDA